MNLNYDEDWEADLKELSLKSRAWPVWVDCFLYFFVSMSLCIGFVLCCGVINDDGNWDDEPEFFSSGN